MNLQTRQELHDLLSALLDEALTPAQQDRLGDLLREHPQARDLYLAYFALHADLVLRGDTGDRVRPLLLTGTDGRGDKETRRTSPHSRVSWSPRLLVSLAALAAGLLLVWAYAAYWQRSPVGPNVTDPATEPTHQTVAVLLQAPEAEWEESDLPTRVGAPLPA